MITVNTIVFILLYIFNGILVIQKLNLKLFILHPINVVSVYFLVFFIIPIIIGDFYIPFSLEYIYEDLKQYLLEVSFTVLLTYFILSVLNYIYLRKIVYGTKLISTPKYGNILELFLSLYILIIIAIIIVLINKSGGIYVLINNFAYFTIQARNGNTALLMLIYSVELLPILYFILSRKRNYVFLFLLILFAMFSVTIVGARTLVVSIVISTTLLFIFYYDIKIRKLFYIFLLFLIFFMGSSAIRNTGASTESITFNERFERLITYFSHNLDQLTTSLLVYHKIEKNEISLQLGKTGIDIGYFLIPKTVLPSKPKSFYPSRLVYPDLIESGLEQNVRHTFNFGMIGRPYLDFGIIGVVVLNALLFFIFIRVYYSIVINLESHSNLIQVFLLYVYSHVHQVYILGAWSHVISIFIFNFILIICIFIMFEFLKMLIPVKKE